MSWCGLALTIGGVSYDFQNLEFQQTNEGITGKIIIKTGVNAAPSPAITYHSQVIITDLSANTVFFGVVKRKPVKRDIRAGNATWEIIIEDYIAYYNNITVNMNFRGTTITDAFTTLLNVYCASDGQGTINQYIEDVTTSYVGRGLGDAIRDIISLCSTEIQWTVTLVGGVVTHHLTEKFQTKISDIDGLHDIASQPFELSDEAIKNVVTVVGKNLIMPNKHQQDWFFGYYDSTEPPANYDQNMIGIPLEHSPQNLQIMLLIGSTTGDFASTYNLTEIELPFETLSKDADPLLSVDLSKYIKPYQRIMPDAIMGTSEPVTRILFDSKRQWVSSAPQPNTQEYFWGWYSDKFKCKYDPQPAESMVDQTKNGVLYVYTLNYIKNNINIVNQALHLSIDPASIIGYRLYYDILGDFSKTFKDDTSIATYGERRSETETFNGRTVAQLMIYGQLRVQQLAAESMAGQVTIYKYHKGNLDYTDWPQVGNTVDVTTVYGTTSDVEIRSVDVYADGNATKITISAQNRSKKSIVIDSLLKNFMNKINALNQTSQALPFPNVIEQGLTLTLTVASPSASILAASDFILDGSRTLEETIWV